MVSGERNVAAGPTRAPSPRPTADRRPGNPLARLGLTGPPSRRPREDVVRALEGGAGELLWKVGGEPVAQAAARAVSAGMSRIGPVYTPPEHRRHGYAAAVTAAAAQWAQDRGARHVLLYTDLANPTTNRLYPRLGFRPRYDAVELRFAPAADRR